MPKRPEIKLIALDMDGTLLTPDGDVSKGNAEAIQQAMDKGVQVMLSTGRWLRSCYPIAEQLKLNTYLITVNGGEIWTAEKELLERHLLDSRTMKELWEIGQTHDANMWLVSTDGLFTRGKAPDDFMAHEWLKIGFSSFDKAALAEIQKKLNAFEELELTNSLPTNIEVNPLGVNKAGGLKSVCKALGITMNEVMAVGDSLNDIKMIAESGLGVAMGNAQDRVKAVAKYTTETNEKDGVARAIERFIL